MTAEIFRTPLSAVNNVRQTCTHTITLQEAAESVTGQENAPAVAKIRQLLAVGEIEKATAKKKELSAIMFSGTFKKRNSDSIIQHSGLMVLDFDHCGTEKKAKLAADPHSVLCFVSPSGDGLKLVIRIEPDAEQHGASFDAARIYFSEKYRLNVDPSGRDVSRLCFVSHDPDAIFHAESEVLHRPHRPHMTTNDNQDNISKGERGGGCSCPPAHKVDEILSMTQPSQPGQRHHQIFNLARGLTFECGLMDEPFSKLKPIVRRWFDMAKLKIGTQSFSESWSDFVHAWPRVKKPLLENTFAAAWDAVQAGELPPIAQDYDEPRIQRLVGLCWHLGKDSESFYLSTHKAGPLLDVKPMQVLRWLKMLQADEILLLVKQGNRHLATTYQWTRGAPD